MPRGGGGDVSEGSWPATTPCALEGCADPAFGPWDDGPQPTIGGHTVSEFCLPHGALVWQAGRVRSTEPLSNDKQVPCAAEDCPGAGLGGTRITATGEHIGQYCFIHAKLISTYGKPTRPAVLAGRPRCSYVDEDRADRECREPSVAHKLCLEHLTGGEDLQSARATLHFLRRRPPQSLASPTQDTWRVLQEVDDIRTRGGMLPQLPRSDFYSAGRLIVGMLTGGVIGREERLNRAHEMSPYAIGRTLDLPHEQVAVHLEHLAGAGLVKEDQTLALPEDELIVVLAVTVPRELARTLKRRRRAQRVRWALRRLRPPLPYFRLSSFRFALPDNLPTAGEVVVKPVGHGPGLLAPQHQGRCLALTYRGRVELQAWRERHLDAEERRRSDKTSRRMAVAALLIGGASLVSIIADAPGALEAIRAAWAALQH